MSDISNLRGTIVPKSDQLNAEQLLAGDLTITVRDVRMGSEEQPVIIHYDGEDGHPYKPGKTMRKVLIFAWGEDGREWIGKSMTLYNDQAVRFGGMAVGGIRISHLSHIERDIAISLTATKGKKAQHTIQRLEIVELKAVLAAIASATNKASMDAAKSLAQQLKDLDEIETARKAYAERVGTLKAKPEAAKQPTSEPSYAELADRIVKATSQPEKDQVMLQARHLPANLYDDLVNLAFPTTTESPK